MESFSERLDIHRLRNEKQFIQEPLASVCMPFLESISDQFHLDCDSFDLRSPNANDFTIFMASKNCLRKSYQCLLSSYYLMSFGLYNPAIGILRLVLESKLMADRFSDHTSLADEYHQYYTGEKKQMNQLEWSDILEGVSSFWIKLGLYHLYKDLCSYVHTGTQPNINELMYSEHHKKATFPIYGMYDQKLSEIAIGHWIRVALLLSNQDVTCENTLKVKICDEIINFVWEWKPEKAKSLFVYSFETNDISERKYPNKGLSDILNGILPICKCEAMKWQSMTKDNIIPLPVLSIKGKAYILDEIAAYLDREDRKKYDQLPKKTPYTQLLREKERIITNCIPEKKRMILCRRMFEWAELLGFKPY